MPVKSQTAATLLDVIVDGFEGFQGCMESVGGGRRRQLPMPTAEEALVKFNDFVADASRWKSTPAWPHDTDTRKVATWSDLQIRWEGRGVLVLVPDPNFDSWRLFWTQDTLTAMLASKGLTAPIVGMTTPNGDHRGQQILDTVTKMGLAPTDIVILEDEEDVAPFNGRRIQPTFDGSRAGFQDRHLTRALTMLGVTHP